MLQQVTELFDILVLAYLGCSGNVAIKMNECGCVRVCLLKRTSQEWTYKYRTFHLQNILLSEAKSPHKE